MPSEAWLRGLQVALFSLLVALKPGGCFYCVSSGEWIPIDWVCDAQSDCSDSSDESYDLNCVYQKIFLKKGQDSPWHNSPWGPPDFGKRSGHFKTSYHHSTLTSPADIGIQNNQISSSESKRSTRKHQTDSQSNTEQTGFNHFWFGNPSLMSKVDPLASKETVPESQMSLEDSKNSKVSGKKGPESQDHQDQKIEARSPASSSPSIFSDPVLQNELVELTKRLNMILLRTPQLGSERPDDRKRTELDSINKYGSQNHGESLKITEDPSKNIPINEGSPKIGDEQNKTDRLVMRGPTMNHSNQKEPVKLPNNTQPERNGSQALRNSELPRETHTVVDLPERSNKPKLGHLFRSSDSI